MAESAPVKVLRSKPQSKRPPLDVPEAPPKFKSREWLAQKRQDTSTVAFLKNHRRSLLFQYAEACYSFFLTEQEEKETLFRFLRCGYIRSMDERKELEQATEKKDVAQQNMDRLHYKWVELNEQGILRLERRQLDMKGGRTYTTQEVYSLTPEQILWNQDKSCAEAKKHNIPSHEKAASALCAALDRDQSRGSANEDGESSGQLPAAGDHEVRRRTSGKPEWTQESEIALPSEQWGNSHDNETIDNGGNELNESDLDAVQAEPGSSDAKTCARPKFRKKDSEDAPVYYNKWCTLPPFIIRRMLGARRKQRPQKYAKFKAMAAKVNAQRLLREPLRSPQALTKLPGAPLKVPKPPPMPPPQPLLRKPLQSHQALAPVAKHPPPSPREFPNKSFRSLYFVIDTCISREQIQVPLRPEKPWKSELLRAAEGALAKARAHQRAHQRVWGNAAQKFNVGVSQPRLV